MKIFAVLILHYTPSTHIVSTTHPLVKATWIISGHSPDMYEHTGQVVSHGCSGISDELCMLLLWGKRVILPFSCQECMKILRLSTLHKQVACQNKKCTVSYGCDKVGCSLCPICQLPVYHFICVVYCSFYNIQYTLRHYYPGFV